MNFGLNIADFETLKKVVFEPLKNAGFSIYVFGSRATGKHHPFSDIDILLEHSDSENTSILREVKEAIEEARFPVKVDFVSSDSLAESYRQRVHAEKIRV